MKYEQIAPPAYLKNNVRYFWTFEYNNAEDTPITFKPIADGCPGLMFYQSARGDIFQQDKKVPDLFVYGQTTIQTTIQMQGQFRIIGAVFHPHALHSLFGFDADILTDSCTDLANVADGIVVLHEQLVNTSSIIDQTSLLSSSLLRLLENNKAMGNEMIHYAIARIGQMNGNISFKDLLDKTQVTERTFERQFKKTVGISPKLYARICQFQSALYQLRSEKYKKLSDIAFENEYADQSHFSRVFKEFSGFSPYRYHKIPKKAAENFVALT